MTRKSASSFMGREIQLRYQMSLEGRLDSPMLHFNIQNDQWTNTYIEGINAIKRRVVRIDTNWTQKEIMDLRLPWQLFKEVNLTWNHKGDWIFICVRTRVSGDYRAPEFGEIHIFRHILEKFDNSKQRFSFLSCANRTQLQKIEAYPIRLLLQ